MRSVCGLPEQIVFAYVARGMYVGKREVQLCELQYELSIVGRRTDKGSGSGQRRKKTVVIFFFLMPSVAQPLDGSLHARVLHLLLIPTLFSFLPRPTPRANILFPQLCYKNNSTLLPWDNLPSTSVLPLPMPASQGSKISVPTKAV